MKSSIKKQVLALLSILMTATAAKADSLYIDPFEISGGETKEVSVCLTNSQPVTALQAEILLDSGLSLVPEGDNWMTLASRGSADHTLVVNTTGRDIVKFVCFSNTNATFSGNEGAVLNMRIMADADYSGGMITLTKIKLSDGSNPDILLENTTCEVTGIINAESISLNYDSVNLKVGETLSLDAFVFPDNTTDKTLTWTSDNSEVVSVDSNGLLSAVSLGSAVITVTCGNVSATCSVTVVPTEVESVTLNETEARLKVGESIALSATVYPEDATDKTVTWVSDNPVVATVDGNGNVIAVGLGSATITASCGNVTATCYVTVDPVLVETITLSTINWSGEEGESFHIDATVLPEDATEKRLVWTSSDESIAKVDDEGNVSVLKEGSCIITVTASDGSGVSAECIITSSAGVDGIFSDNENFDIYGFGGILVKRVCGRESFKDLTPGIYIIRQGSAMKKLVIR